MEGEAAVDTWNYGDEGGDWEMVMVDGTWWWREGESERWMRGTKRGASERFLWLSSVTEWTSGLGALDAFHARIHFAGVSPSLCWR